jgi:hypothetical protein
MNKPLSVSELMKLEIAIFKAEKNLALLKERKEAYFGARAISRDLHVSKCLPDGTIFLGSVPGQIEHLYVMPHDLCGAFSWSEAKEWARAERFGGHRDWRLPSISELKQLSLQRDLVGSFSPCSYWSGTTSSLDTSKAWRVNFGITVHYLEDTSNPLQVRLVRSL